MSQVRWQNEGSFGFAKRWLLRRAKTNVPECAVGFHFLFCLYAAKIPLSFCRLFCLFTMNANVTHMPSGGLRAIQLSNRGEV
jgi:hypothetical protein